MHGTTGADVERVKREIEEVIGIDCSHAICASAKQVVLTQLLICPSCSHRVTTAVPSSSEQRSYIHLTQVRLHKCFVASIHGNRQKLHRYTAKL